MSDEVAKRLHGDDGAGERIIFGNRLLEKELQGFPGASAEFDKKLPVIRKVTTQDLRDAESLCRLRPLSWPSGSLVASTLYAVTGRPVS